MTCIVGYADLGKGRKRSRVVLGADKGLYGDDGSVEVSPHPKIFSRQMGGIGDEFIMGACGDVAFGDQLEQIDFSKIKITKEHQENAGDFLRNVFVPFLKKKVKPCKDSEILIGIFDSLYKIDEGYGVVSIGESGFAIGESYAPARATLYALHKLNTEGGRKKIDALEMVTLALESAQSVSVYCRGPFDIMELA